MPRSDRVSLTVGEDIKAALNRARKDRGQSWDAFLTDCLEALEADGEAVKVEAIQPGALKDLSSSVAHQVLKELGAGPW